MKTTIGSQITVYDPTEELRRWARRNLVIANPEYAKKQRMGLWMGETEKKIYLYEESVGVLRMPYGVIRDLRPFLLNSEIDLLYAEPQKVDFERAVPLYPYQEEAVDGMVKARYGILQSPAGSGKTQMGLALASLLGCRTLWLTHTKDLLKQSKDRAEQYFDSSKFGVISEGKVSIGETITFATIQTMSHCDLYNLRFVWDCIIVDECHRVAGTPTAVTMFSKVLNNLCARHKYGLSATVHRADGMIRATTALLGPVVYQVPDEAVEEKIMHVTVRPKGTGTRLGYSCLRSDGMLDYAKMITYLTKDLERNWMIVNDLLDSKDHYNLILSERVDHLKNLYFGVAEHHDEDDLAIIDGKTPKVEREQALDDLRSGKKHYLFATYQLAKEGLDIPRLDRLFLATPQKDYAVVTQAIGRVARTFPGKGEPVVYDYVDNAEVLLRRYKQRCRHYRKAGARIEEEA